MDIKKQLAKIKDNWLLIAITIVVFIFISGIFSGGSLTRMASYDESLSQQADASYDKASYAEGVGGGYGFPIPNEDFAPGVQDRKIVKTSSMSTEVERETFYDSEKKLLDIVKSSDSYLLSQNVNRYGTDRKSYLNGNYQIKVDVEKYDSVVTQLKSIGKVQSFNENSNDVTGQYTDLKIEIESEKARLKRYETMYAEAKEIKDKIDINDRMFDLERQIKYLEDSLKNIDQKVEYSTIYITITEKKSEYYDIMFVKLSELISLAVGSSNTLIRFLMTILPWALAFLIIRFVVKRFRK